MAATEAQKENLAKARAAAKAKREERARLLNEAAEAEAAAEVNTPLPNQPSEKEIESEADIERMARDSERAMGEKLEKDEKIPFIIPLDPGLSADNQVWERSFNGLFLRFRRGVEYSQPRYIVNYIMQKVYDEQRARASVADYMTGSGKKLSR